MKKAKDKKFRHLTYTQRLQLEAFLKAKLSKQRIAELLGCSLSTVYLEISRGRYEHKIVKYEYYTGERIYDKEIRYSAEIGQRKYAENATTKGRPLKVGKDFEFVNYINNRVKTEKISACAVLGEIKRKQMSFKTNISKTTLYRYIDIGIFDNIRLSGKRKKKYRQQQGKRAPRGTSIEQRPQEISLRNTFGHWEMDCVCGPTLPTLLVLSERLTRKEIIIKMKNQRADSVVRCLNGLERKFGKSFSQVFKSITVDNGVEFSDFKGLERSVFNKKASRTKVYYCHPYCSSERGTNERLNREIRRLIPKGTDLNEISVKDVRRVERWVNNYPREVLNYDCSEELFNQELQRLSVCAA